MLCMATSYFGYGYSSTLRTVFLKPLMLRARCARNIKGFRKTVRSNVNARLRTMKGIHHTLFHFDGEPKEPILPPFSRRTIPFRNIVSSWATFAIGVMFYGMKNSDSSIGVAE